MSSSTSELTLHQRQSIIDDFKRALTPQQIILSWNSSIMNRSPSVETVYRIIRRFKISHSDKPLKRGPRNKRILTPQKLNEVEKVVQQIPESSSRSIGSICKIECRIRI